MIQFCRSPAWIAAALALSVAAAKAQTAPVKIIVPIGPGGSYDPARTPPEVIARLRRDIRASLPDLKARFEKSGGEAWGLPDDRLEAFVASEHQNWTKLIREAGIKLD
jgi:tripartite-type tricarboxylate transporter receptor subunit TctC